MFEQLGDLESRYEELGRRLNDPEIIADQSLWQKTMREHADLTPLVEAYQKYRQALQLEQDSLELLEEESDEELRQIAKDELVQGRAQAAEQERRLKFLLLPKDPNDEKNVFVEIRAGAGGDEAALFASELYRMYSRYAERKGWKISITGQGAYSKLKYESGVHRVQRVPVTESGGRIHTSTVTVAVLPEVEDVEVEIKPGDIRIDVFRSSGNGGQCVNTTDSAVRITHFPTGIVVSCQDEKSQLKNKDKALKVLRSRLYDLELAKQQAAVSANRRSQVGTGDRSEKIRTYNFPQTRITDHRVKLTLYKMENVLDGDLDELIDYITAVDQAEKLKENE